LLLNILYGIWLRLKSLSKLISRCVLLSDLPLWLILYVGEQEGTKKYREQACGSNSAEVDLDVEQTQAERRDEPCRDMRHAINQTKQPKALRLQLVPAISRSLAY
jgi:hypothetical protein